MTGHRAFGGGLSWLADIQAWTTTDYAGACSVLTDRRLRLPTPPEFVTGRTQVFSLTTYLLDAADCHRARTVLGAWVNSTFASGASQLRDTIEGLANRASAAFDISALPSKLDGGVRGLADELILAAVGGDRTAALEVLASLRVAKRAHQRGEEDVRRVAIATAWTTASDLVVSTDDGGFVSFLSEAGLDRRVEAALVLPFFEMAVYGQHAQLAIELTHRVVGASDPPHDRATMEAWAIEASRFLGGIEPTRVATTDCSIAGTPMRVGDRVLVDIMAANTDIGVYPAASTFRPGRDVPPLTFGMGSHRCLGRPVALALAGAVASPLAVASRQRTAGDDGPT